MNGKAQYTIVGCAVLGLSFSVLLLVGNPIIPEGDTPPQRTDATHTETTIEAVEPNTEELHIRAVDGAEYNQASFTNTLPSDEDYFPIGVWLASVVDQGNLDLDLEVGINTYVELTANSDIQRAMDAGMSVLSSSASEIANAYVMPDEVDMWGGAGDSSWTGNYPGQGDICQPSTDSCGFTIQSTAASIAPDRQMIYANFGKGVTFWEDNETAAKFVNHYSDIVSADNYWFTDPNICGQDEGGTLFSPAKVLTPSECRNAANYGWTVDRMQSLVSPKGSKPVWSFVELGHPASEPDAPTITEDQIVASVWSSLVHGARGIIYFNHSFNGECPTQNVMRDCGTELRSTLIQLNATITSMAKVLNAPDVVAGVQVTGQVDYAVKYLEDTVLVLVTHSADGDGKFSVNVPCSDATNVASDTGSDGTAKLRNASFSDTLSPDSPIDTFAIDASNCKVIAE